MNIITHRVILVKVQEVTQEDPNYTTPSPYNFGLWHADEVCYVLIQSRCHIVCSLVIS